MDKAVMGSCRLGFFRLGVLNDNWDNLVQTVENFGGASLTATRRRLMLMGRDSTTGWYNKAYEQSDIEIVLLTKTQQRIALACGTYVRGDFLGLTADVLEADDEVKVDDDYYTVETVKEHKPFGSFSHRECDLTLAPFKNLTGATYTQSTVEDARQRTRVWLETRLRNAYLPNYITAYGFPDHSLKQIFRTKNMDLVFSVLDPEPAKPIVDAGHYAYAYEERVPIETYCIDKSNIDGAKLQWQAASELRYISENYPLGSKRSLEEMRPNRKEFGNTTLFSQRFILSYTRDKT